MDKEIPNIICSECLKWEKFEKNCNVFWHGKKMCSRRVTNMDEWEQEQKLLR